MNKLETERLLLREIYIDDLEDMYEYSMNSNVGPNAGWKPHESREETRQIMKEVFIGEEAVWGIVLKDTNKLIGTIGLIADPKRENAKSSMLGYAIGEPYWGNGYMSEAARNVLDYGFNYMELDIISAYCYPFNERSKNVIKKLGFGYEGTLKMASQIYDGQIFDNECYSLTKEDYFNKQTV